MHTRLNEFARSLVLPALATLALAGCAGVGQRPATELVAERAQLRWDAVVANRLEDAYGYFAPGYRSALSLQAYIQRMAVRRMVYTGAKVTATECAETTCKVKALVDVDVIGALPGVQRMGAALPVEEDWIFTAGEWFLLPDK